jgi:S-layer protein (TIGR01567 family)
MKRFTTIALVALLAIAALVMPAFAAEDVEEPIEVRSQVFNASKFEDFTTGIEINSTNFAGFWYDIDDGLSSEVLLINTTDTKFAKGKSVYERGITYTAKIEQSDYEADFDNESVGTSDLTKYPVIGLFAEKYVPTDDTDASELAKLLIDTDDKYTLRTGSPLELAGGYELTAKQIDVEGDKVWMELSKDGEFVEDEVIDVTDGQATWDYDVDVGDQSDVIVFRCLVTDVFQGQVDSLAVVEGLWLIDYENILEIESSDTFGEFEVDSTGNAQIVMFNDGTLTFSNDKKVNLYEDLYFQTADSDAGDLRFYLAKEYTEPGTYEVRGSVAEDGNGDYYWDAHSFAGFWYDLDDNKNSEKLSIKVTKNNVIEEEDLWYNTTIVQSDYEADFDVEPGNNDPDTNMSFPIIGLFAEEYVSIDDEDPGELVKLLLDNDDKYTLRTGSALDLPGGYELTAKQIDVEGDKVWMELSKDGEFIEDEVVDVTDGEATWDYDVDVGDQSDVIVFRCLVTDVFQGQVDSLAVVEGLWLIDYENILEIETSDEFKELEVKEVGGKKIAMFNSGTITLSKDKEITLAEDFKLKTADNSTLRYYPFVERTIGDGPDITEPVTPVEPEPPAADNQSDVVTPPTGEEQPPADEPAGDEPAGDEPAGDEPGDDNGIPGFEAVFAVAGLLAVAYLVRRN